MRMTDEQITKVLDQMAAQEYSNSQIYQIISSLQQGLNIDSIKSYWHIDISQDKMNLMHNSLKNNIDISYYDPLSQSIQTMTKIKKVMSVKCMSLQDKVAKVALIKLEG